MITNPIFNEYDFEGILLKNRIIMAPMTRCRTTQPGDIPNSLMAEYYAQRSSAGLIITEATQISKQGQGYSYTPGIYTDEQIKGWKNITDTIHNKGGKIFLQIWHVGRMSHPSFHEDKQTVAPSALSPNSTVWVADEHKAGEMLPCPVPRALSIDEIKNIINDYTLAARNAKKAGFDGVEIHSGNGYLLDQFMRSSSNTRTDEYGGNIENRLRFVLEVVSAVAKEIGINRTGIRLSPHNISRGMDCPEIIDATYLLAEKLNEMKLLYIHFAEADWDNAPEVPLSFRKKIRNIFKGNIIVAGKYDKNRANEIIENNLADLIAFGRNFIANPDFAERLEKNIPLSPYRDDKLFGGDSEGYTDYPRANQ